MSRANLSYAIDEHDYLVKVDDGFYGFAAENGWDGAGDCLGRSLWDFVAGQELKKIQRMLLRRIRDEVRGVDLPFRCDSPDVRREMDIRIASSATGRLVQFKARVRLEEQREFQPLLDPEASRGDDLIEMCGWCDRFLADSGWVEVEEAAARLKLFQRSDPPAISHGICPDCTETLMAA